MPPDVFALLFESFRCLEHEAPEAARALKLAMGGCRAKLVAEGRAKVVAVEESDWTLLDGAERADIVVQFDRRAVIDLAEARLSLEQALVGERISVTGEIAAAERLNDALMIYLEGLMRAPGAAKLYRRFYQA